VGFFPFSPLAGAGAGLGYVLPGTVGYLGSTGLLAPYSPPASGLPGAGNAPQGCVWAADGLHCTTVANMILDHVYIYGGITFTGSTLTITNSFIQAGTANEYWCVRGTGMPAAAAGGAINLVDCTFGWGGPNFYPPANDTAFITDNSGPLYNIIRCDIGTSRTTIASGFPQGINPASGQMIDCWIHNVFQVNPGLPTHLDGVFMQGGINFITHGCYITVPNLSYTTAAFFTQSGGAIPNVTLTSNFLDGGSITFHNENGTNCVVADNTFGANVNGPAANDTGNGTIAAWYNNKLLATGAAVPNPYIPLIPATVTATESGSASNGIALDVLVYTGAANVQPGVTAGATQITPSLSITPGHANSTIAGSQLGLTGVYTVIAGTTSDFNLTAAGLQMLAYHSTISPIISTPTSYGYTATANSISQVLAEILAAGVTPPAIDASSPAGVSTAAAASSRSCARSGKRPATRA